VSVEREPIRSYQRIFRPERRIYQLEGRTLPVPGGVSLRWLAYALAALGAVLVIGSGSFGLAVAIAIGAGCAGFFVGGLLSAVLAGAAALSALWLAAALLGALDWPLRLIVIPAALATFATQATPDGRHADRFAASWLALRLAPRRRSLGRALPSAGTAHLPEGELWVAPDEHGPRLRRARIRGAGTVGFAEEVALRRRGSRRLIASPVARRRREGLRARRLALGADEVLELRP
jgi:hypothetical protein